MAAKKSSFACSSCGHEEPKWLGKCPGCGAWNSFKELSPSPKGGPGALSSVPIPSEPVNLTEIEATSPSHRLSTGINELDRVLGSGLMRGSVILIGGEPGIGKSTLMLQLSNNYPSPDSVLYISGEETPSQIKLRAERLGVKRENLLLYCSGHLESILEQIKKKKPALVIVDSIQTLFSDRAGAVPGTVNQLKMATYELTALTKQLGISLVLLAHVTKEGAIAGPKTVEHMVDTVLYFDHNRQGDLRVLRPVKNRFGAVEDIGLFTMESRGLCSLDNPSKMFLSHREGGAPAGTAIAAVYEGSRILFAEIQALVVPCKGAASRVYSDRIDSIRINRISAILEKHLGVRFSDQDIYINVSGGLKIADVGCDFALALALYSARTSLPVRTGILAVGELALSGEIHNASHLVRRIKAGREMGLNTFLIPRYPRELKNSEDTVVTADLGGGIQAAFTSSQEG